jgi:hypothetical protein
MVGWTNGWMDGQVGRWTDGLIEGNVGKTDELYTTTQPLTHTHSAGG